MTPRAHDPSWKRRRSAALAGLAILTILEHLSRKGRLAMSTAPDSEPRRASAALPTMPRSGDRAPGEHEASGEVWASVRTCLIGLALAALLTAGSFAISYTDLIYGPGVPIALIVFAIAQMGVHLVFFLHLTTAPDNVNNAMALAFGVLIVLLLIGGTLWIMMHMNQTMMPAGTVHPGHM